MVDLSRFKTFVVVGAGTMGREIAQVALMSNLFDKVILNDINENVLSTAKKYITAGLEKIESKGKLGQGLTANSLMNNLSTSKNLITSIKEADFIVEAIPEVMELKQELFKELGEYAPEH
ncbi:MAG: 3-hydroxyacyl-CoA dehydrogenase NAD-binding domain-containing protein, partial [Promethearchaeota archaeon]